MGHFSVQTRIEASVEDVWQVLADYGAIYRWNPGIVASQLIGDQAEGVGAARYCDLGGGNYLEETVTEWQPNHRQTVRITGTNLPYKTADIPFTLRREDESTTVVELAPDYTLKLGPLGVLLDRLYVRRVYQKAMKALLQGLKEYVESGASPA